jgi:hypothetical protein
MSDVLRGLDADIAELEADIVRNPDPRPIRIKRLKEMRQNYVEIQGLEPQNAAVGGATAGMPSSFVDVFQPFLESAVPSFLQSAVPAGPRAAGRRPSPERVRALAAARELLAGKIEPTRTADILDHLISRGIPVAGADPLNSLSAMLSNADDFTPHGRYGWTLIRTTEAAS